MDISKNRLEAFSDAIIAIIITIMVLDIPVPKDFTFESIRDMGVSFFIYFVSFIVVGAQWVKHHYLFNFCKFDINKSFSYFTLFSSVLIVFFMYFSLFYFYLNI